MTAIRCDGCVSFGAYLIGRFLETDLEDFEILCGSYLV
jgi:hypothetical protein